MVAGFKAGAEWNGNRNGRPKKTYCRDDFTNEIFRERKEDIREVTQKLFEHAKGGQPWAIKLVYDYFMTRAKARDEEESDNRVMAVNLAATLPGDVLGQIKELILKSQERKDALH